MGMNGSKIVWPEGRKFAFTVVDDTDKSTVSNTRPVYDFLFDQGFLTTKTVWPLKPLGNAKTGGQSLEDSQYRDWIMELKSRGYEIALHGVSDESSDRRRVIDGLKLFKDIVGHDPLIHANHVGQREGIYWGDARFDGLVSKTYRMLASSLDYSGHKQSTPYFWGDLCKNRIKFVRNFTFKNINTLNMDPFMPYHDPNRPYVQYWFSSSEGSGPKAFCELISEANQDRLMEEGGACIVYTHFGSSFWKMPADFVALMKRLAKLPGWFVPASKMLTHIGEARGWCNVENHRRSFRNMQWRWLVEHILARRH